jgi:hypothetical protein
MPTDAVWIVITIPKEEHELQQAQQDVKTKRVIRYDDNNFLSTESNNNLKNNLKISSASIGDPLEKVLEECLLDLGIEDAVWISSKSNQLHHVYFAVDLYENDSTLTYLQSKGIGVKKNSSIGYIPFGLFFTNEVVSDEEGDDDVFTSASISDNANNANNANSSKLEIHKKGVTGFKRIQEEFLKSVTSRLTVAQVVNGVRASSELTFDFVMYAIFAGCIAAAGLLNNSAVDVAAAMMIEPVMATVIAITFGLVIRDASLTLTGVRSCIISLIICLVVGYIYGAIAFIWMKEWNPPPSGYWPTPEMSVRGEWRTLWYGALQALAAGGAIAVTLLNDNQAALVGVAVASTFLPPFINTGLLWAYATHITIRGHGQPFEWYNGTGRPILMKKAWIPSPGYEPAHYQDMRWEIMALSGVSMIYTLVNIVCMLAMAYVILRVKEVVPLGSLEPNKRFFTKDIKVAREFNRRMTQANLKGIDNEGMGDQILSEWAEIAGLDAGTLLSDKPEAAVTRRQTLHDILADVNLDNTYQSVTKSGVGVKNESDNFIRGLTSGSIYRRKSSLNPGCLPHIYDVESNVKRNFSRRSSRWYPSSTLNIEQATPHHSSSISSMNPADLPGRRPISSTSSANRGLRPQDVAAGSRRNSAMLRKTLKESEHSPFSLWPSRTSREKLSSSSSMHLDPRDAEFRRRKSAVPFSRRASRVPNSPTGRSEGAINESFESE